MIREKRNNILAAAQNVIHKALERLLGADFHESAHAIGVHGLQPFDPLDGRRNLQFQNVLDVFNRDGIEFARDIGHQGQARLADAQAIQHNAQGFGCRRNNLGVEGVAHRDAHGPEALRAEAGDGLFHGLACAADHGLAGGVDVGGHHVAVDLLQGCLDHIQGRHDRGHPAVVIHAHLGHFSAPGRRSFQRVGEGHDARGDERAVFAQRVAHDHIRRKAVFAQQLVKRHVHGEHGRLGNGRLHEVHLGLLHRGRISAVHKDKAGQGFAQNRRHDLVGFSKNLLNGRLKTGQFPAHVDVLTALTGKEEGDLARFGAAAPEDALGLQRLPCLRVVEACRLARLGDLFL